MSLKSRLFRHYKKQSAKVAPKLLTASEKAKYNLGLSEYLKDKEKAHLELPEVKAEAEVEAEDEDNELLPLPLPQFLKKSLKLLGYKCLKVVSPSPNAFTLTLTKNSKETSVFVKCLDEEDVEFFDLHFANEVIFYGKIIPAFLSLEEQYARNINVPFTSCPQCHHVEQEFIMLEDLTTSGYKSAEIAVKKSPMSLHCVRVVLQQLGRFHAFSIALQHHEPAKFARIVAELHETESDRKICVEGVQDALKLAKASFPKGSLYVEKLSYLYFDLYKENTTTKDEGEDQCQVITHGDLWPNNIWFKKLENQDGDDDVGQRIDNAVFVDLQGCRLQSPIKDLMSVLLLAVDKETREEHRDELLACYYSAVCLKLEELNVCADIFSKQCFYDALRTQTKYALTMALVGLPLYIQDSQQVSTDQSTDGSTDEDAVVVYFRQLRMRKTMQCKNKMLEIIMDVVDQGCLD